LGVGCAGSVWFDGLTTNGQEMVDRSQSQSVKARLGPEGPEHQLDSGLCLMAINRISGAMRNMSFRGRSRRIWPLNRHCCRQKSRGVSFCGRLKLAT